MWTERLKTRLEHLWHQIGVTDYKRLNDFATILFPVEIKNILHFFAVFYFSEIISTNQKVTSRSRSFIYHHKPAKQQFQRTNNFPVLFKPRKKYFRHCNKANYDLRSRLHNKGELCTNLFYCQVCTYGIGTKFKSISIYSHWVFYSCVAFKFCCDKIEFITRSAELNFTK